MAEVVATFLIVALFFLALQVRSATRRRYRAELPVMPAGLSARQQAQIIHVSTLEADAREILQRVYRGGTASRRSMTGIMSERRWRAAVELLRALRIFGYDDTIPAVSERRAEQRLAEWRQVQAANSARANGYVTTN